MAGVSDPAMASKSVTGACNPVRASRSVTGASIAITELSGQETKSSDEEIKPSDEETNPSDFVDLKSKQLIEFCKAGSVPTEIDHAPHGTDGNRILKMGVARLRWRVNTRSPCYHRQGRLEVVNIMTSGMCLMVINRWIHRSAAGIVHLQPSSPPAVSIHLGRWGVDAHEGTGCRLLATGCVRVARQPKPWAAGGKAEGAFPSLLADLHAVVVVVAVAVPAAAADG